jgi:hypothetical protein
VVQRIFAFKTVVRIRLFQRLEHVAHGLSRTGGEIHGGIDIAHRLLFAANFSRKRNEADKTGHV